MGAATRPTTHRIASHRIASHRIASHRIASTDPTPARQVSPPDTTRRIGHALRVRPVAPAVHQALGPAGAASRTSQCARQSPK
ncbi:hypothetical protein AQ902_10015 [Burkholderia pseudomallei]|nr:hypothetical protein AQ902_10015 [Burkholderia pseudomallei]ONC07620.1 hypothetical protein AQ909_28390 [Burkholderia pseudomallei]